MISCSAFVSHQKVQAIDSEEIIRSDPNRELSSRQAVTVHLQSMPNLRINANLVLRSSD